MLGNVLDTPVINKIKFLPLFYAKSRVLMHLKIFIRNYEKHHNSNLLNTSYCFQYVIPGTGQPHLI